MDKRFLYRGKRRDNDEWVYGYFARMGWTGKELPYIIPIYASAWYGFEIDPATLGQCTGVTAAKSYRGDRPEDLLVFEGDVLTALSYPFQDEGKQNYNAIVHWFQDTAQFGYELKCVNPDKRGISNGLCEGICEREDEWEIIGTIHDQLGGNEYA